MDLRLLPMLALLYLLSFLDRGNSMFNRVLQEADVARAIGGPCDNKRLTTTA